MSKASIKALKHHWESLREGHLPPFRSEISPRALPDMLDNLFIFERLNAGDIRVRIAGIKLCEMMGREVRGQSPLSFFNKNARGRFSAVLSDVLNRPTVARLGLETSGSNGIISNAEMLLLPLRSDFGDVNRIIGCVTEPFTGFSAPISYSIKTIDLDGISHKSAHRYEMENGFAEKRRGFIMDGAPVLQTIIGNPAVKSKKTLQKKSFLKVVS